jgi:hypothetical protein
VNEWSELDTRPAVKERSGEVCELCRRARATDMHHRKSAGTGGKWSPVNILHLCRPCHRYVTDYPAVAYARGASLRHGDDPETTPVMRDDGMLFQPTSDVLKARRN